MNVEGDSSRRRPGAGRGRPSREEEGEITDDIVRTALRLFLTRGYGASSMKRIGEEAGVAPNTLYSRFPNKAALFSAAVDAKLASWKVNNPSRPTPPGASVADILEASAIDMLEASLQSDVADLGRLLSVEAQAFPELAKIYGKTVMTAGVADAVDRLTKASDAELTETEAHDLIITLRECVAGHTVLRIFDDPDAGSLHEAARRIVGTIARGWTSDERRAGPDAGG